MAEARERLAVAADYEARRVDVVEAEAVIQLAARFVSAVEALYPD